MRSLSSGLIALVGGLAFFALGLPALAADTSNSEFVIIQEDDVFPEDLYAGAIRVVIDGKLDGDLVAFAAEEIVINGTVTGSVTAVTPNVVVNGEVGGSLRMAANRVEVTGEVGGDLVAAVVSADLGAGSSVSGDVLVWAWDARAVGSIGADLGGTQRHLDLAGLVNGDVDVSVTDLTVVGELDVGGDLGYRSDAEADGLDQATVDGAVVAKSTLPPNLRIRALGLLGRFLIVLFLSMAALSAGYGWPHRTTEAVAEVAGRPIRRWVLGAFILFSPIIVAAITWVMLSLAPATAAFPLLIVLVPLILALAGVSLAIALAAGAPVVAWLGGVLFKRLELYGSILIGSLIVGIVWYLPVIGWLVPVVVLPLGLGSWIATWRDQPSELPTANLGS